MNASVRRAQSLLAVLAISMIGCASVPRDGSSPPATHRAVRGQLVIESDVDLAPWEPLLEELVELGVGIRATLALPPAERPVFVRIFGDADRLHELARKRHPSMADRLAYFVNDAGLLTVYVVAGPEMAEDLRHEVTHGYLHAAVPEIPLWLDEGLAEYFEVGSGLNGWHASHARSLRDELASGRWRPNLARLEGIKSVDQMTQLDYAECWAWTYFLLRAKAGNAKLLAKHLESLRTGQQSIALSAETARAIYRPESAMRDWLLAN